ncbi:MAG TPA: diguanylate cyclase [Treponemataceae bacterium]|nr:diguanylate cyclase [Treponemataceae bacterium]
MRQSSEPVEKGIAVAPKRGETILLNGEWFFTPGLTTEPIYLVVPGVWDLGESTPSSGSYRLSIIDLIPGNLYALQFKGLSTRAQISMNGDLLGSWGYEGVNYIPQTFWFTPKEPSITLKVDMKNDLHSTGGLWLSVLFGDAAAVERTSASDRFMDLLVIGAILMMALYHLTLYIMRREDKSSLFFGLCCIVTVIKTGLSDEQILTMMLPSLNGVPGLRLAYLATILIPITFLLYFHSTFVGHQLRIVLPGMLTLGTISAVLVVFAPVHVMQAWFILYLLAILLLGVYILVALCMEVCDKTLGALTMVFGSIILLLAAINDVLHNLNIISTFYSIGLGIFFFLFTQSILLSRIFSRSFKELKDLNSNLERRVIERTWELEELSRVDNLTGLTNRRYFWVLLEREWARWIRYQQDFCVVMIDLDKFKDLNDTFGHTAGDKALRNLGRLLNKLIRKTDTAARYGGEEFCLILPGTCIAEATSLVEKIRIAFASEPLITQPVPIFKTLSYGIVSASRHASEAEMIEASDKLMYKAKESGRNQGCVEE